MPAQDWSHADFPESTATADGMRTVEAGPPGSRWVFVHLGVPYAVKSDRELHLVVVQPSIDWATGDPTDAAAETFPLVVYVQGSAFREQQLGTALEPLIAFARRGYVVAVVEYRPSSVATFPAQIADAITATRWLLEHAADFHLDPRRVAIWGDSSGGHTALMVTVAGHDRFCTDEPDEPPLPIGCCVDFYGPTAFDLMDDEPTTMAHGAGGSPESDVLGVPNLAAAPDLVRRADPRTYVSADRPLPPILIAHGSKDRLVPFQQSVVMYEALRAAGQPVTLVRVRGAAHGGTTLWTPELLDLVDEFLAQSLR